MKDSVPESKFDRRLFEELYGVQPQAITWMRPVMGNDGVSIIDFEFIYSNREGLKYLDLTEEEHNGLLISNTPTLPHALRQPILEELISVYTTGQESKNDIYNSNLNKYARVLRTRLRDGVLTVIQERTRENRTIDELEEKTRQLEEQKTLLDNIMKNSSNGISVSQVFRNENGKVVDALTILANDAAVRYIGFPREVYLSKKATEIEPAVMDSPYYQACIRTLETGEPFVMQYEMQSTGRWLELTVSRMDRDHLIQIFTDVTPIKEAQLKLERSVEELRRSNESLEEFTTAASHDLKEPIRKVQFFTERLKTKLQGKLSAEEQGLIQKVELASSRMKMLVDDLLEYSHVNAGNEAWEEIDLNEKLKAILTDLELMILEKQAEVKIDPLPVIKGYRRQLQQLFQNLLSNALKYSKPGIPPLILIRSQRISGEEAPFPLPEEEKARPYYFIEMEDNGIGFEPEYADRIFNIFTRLHGNKEYLGSGVGLAIVKKVVENHKGFIRAESEPGKGARFLLLLPA